MARETIVIEHERALLEYLYALLDKGVTDGVTSDQYFEFINKLVEKINRSKSEWGINAKIENESFSNIAEKARELSKRKYCKDSYGIIYESESFGKGTIYPTYDLEKKEWKDYKINFKHYGNPQSITKEFLEKTIKTPSLSRYSLKQVSDKNLQVSKKIAALYVNELIERYIKTRIEKKCWPTQCRDIDKYIFDRNIAPLIDELGTAETFKQAYLQAVRVIAEMKESNILDDPSECIMFSNSEANVLAHANYLKMIAPKQLEFLRPYRYNQYELHNAKIDVTTYDDIAEFKTSACIDSDPYGEWSDTYNHESGVINDGPVLVMERRIGKIGK